MSEFFVAANGNPLTRLSVHVSNVGPWHADLEFEGAPELEGQVVIEVGSLKLSGTLHPAANGTFGLQRKGLVIAGAGGWGSEVGARHYHNDAGVKARTIAEDAARAVGETIGTLVPTSERVGVDYVRQAGPASRALEDAIGGAPWWVDYDGVTQVGPRPARALADTAYEVLAFDPRTRLATLAVDDPSSVQIGSVLSERLDAPLTVREVTIRVTPEELRVLAWCGGTELGHGVLSGLLRTIVQRAGDARLWGKYRYRVVQMASERVNLQSVRKAAGLPDVLPVSMWPGIAGAHAELTPGAEVLVEFLEGDRTLPIVVAFAGKGGPGFVPVSLTLGGESGSGAARIGDNVEVLLPPAVFSGTVNGTPATGFLTFPLNKTLGTITAGSSRVKVAT